MVELESCPALYTDKPWSKEEQNLAVWERQLWVPQLDTEGDAPSCSPLPRHTSSFAVAVFAFHLWLPWTMSPWGGPASCGQAQLCPDACLNWLENYALNPQSQQHFQAGRKQHCHHEKCEVVLLLTALLPAILPQVLNELNWGICRQVSAALRMYLALRSGFHSIVTVQLFRTRCYCLLILSVTWRDHEYPIFHSPVKYNPL